MDANMTDETDVPDGWTEVSVEYMVQHEVYQRRRDGLVISIEDRIMGGPGFKAAALPQNYQHDNTIIKGIGQNGIVAEAEEIEDCREAAFEWMSENDRQR